MDGIIPSNSLFRLKKNPKNSGITQMRFNPPKPMPDKIPGKNYMSHEIAGNNWRSKETPTELSNLRPLTLPFANSHQSQTLFLSNAWRFGFLLSDKNNRLD